MQENRKVLATQMLITYLQRVQDDPAHVNGILNAIDLYKKQFEEMYKKSPTGLIKAIYEAIDAFIKEDKNPGRKFISCKKGCSACCRINVDVRISEARVMLNYARKHKIAIDKEYLKEQAKQIQIAKSPFATCVFLKNNLCSIYPVRPIACRKFAVISSPALCDAAVQTTQVQIYMHLHPEILDTALAEFEQGKPMAQQLLKLLEDEKL